MIKIPPVLPCCYSLKKTCAKHSKIYIKIITQVITCIVVSCNPKKNKPNYTKVKFLKIVQTLDRNKKDFLLVLTGTSH